MTKRDQIEFVLSLDQAESRERITLLRTLVNCLTHVQTVDLFWNELDGRRELLEACIRKLCDGLASGRATRTYREFLDSLFSKFASLSSRDKQTVGSLLRRLHYRAPRALKRDIERFLSGSKYRSLRRRFYNMVSQGESRFDERLLIRMWERYRDPECAWIIAKRGSPDYLKVHREELLDVMSERWQIVRLYLRTIPTYPRLAAELRAIDGISYCYVCAKTRRRISVKTAVEIFERNIGDDRVGLLIWSLGQLRMTAALHHIVASLDQIENAQQERIASKFNLPIGHQDQVIVPLDILG